MKLKFNENGSFVIMQVSDPQDLQHVRHTMVRMLNKAYDTVKPDLVFFTGDNILGNHLRDARFGSRKVIRTREGEFAAMEKAISHIVSPLEKRGIPFTMIFGNHDDMNEISKEEQAGIYLSSPLCAGLGDETTPEIGTFCLPVYSHSGEKKVFNLWGMDSAWMDIEDKKCYQAVKKEAVEWYIRKSEALKAENGGKPLPSLMFQHIALPEMSALMTPAKPSEINAVPSFKNGRKDAWVKLDPAKARGRFGEPICGCRENNGEFDALKQQGDVLALVLGHEHKNNYDATLDGVRILQSSAASFRCYGDRSRGVRVFVLNENDPERFETYNLFYADLCGTSLLSELAYIWDADGEGKKKAALIAGGLTAAAGMLTAGVMKKKK